MVESRILEIIKEELEVDEINLDDDLVEVYEIDSISLLDFFMTIEDEFDIEFEDEELEQLKTINDIIELVEKKTE